jgi:26S proteasome regulatory subunit T3
MSEEDLYKKFKALEKELDFLKIQEDYIKDDQKKLKRELVRSMEELKRI